MKFIRSILNTFIQNSTIQKKLKKNIFRANSKLFTGKITLSASSTSYNYKVLDIFSFGKEKFKKQEQNFININNILKEIKKYESENKKIEEENIKMLKIILEMCYIEFINLFLESKEFEIFKKDPKTEFFNEEIKKQNQPSFDDKDGFLFHFSLPRKRRNKFIFKVERYTKKSNKQCDLKKNDEDVKEKLLNKAFKEDSLIEAYKYLKKVADYKME